MFDAYLVMQILFRIWLSNEVVYLAQIYPWFDLYKKRVGRQTKCQKMHTQRPMVIQDNRDVLRNREHRQELQRVLGRGTVPVLRIDRGDEVEWLPESRDIIRYLRTHRAA